MTRGTTSISRESNFDTLATAASILAAVAEASPFHFNKNTFQFNGEKI
jgi:hypothetical protein